VTESPGAARPELASAGAAVFRPVRTGNAFEETVERLLQAIRLGVAAPGERLPAERELAARLKVSRVTLRDAIHALQDSGYVESRRGRYGGTFVREVLPAGDSPLSVHWERSAAADALEDVLTLRSVLECGSAEAAAARPHTPAARHYLTERLRACGAAGPEDYRRTDSRLHLAVAELAGSASLTAAVAESRTRLNQLLDAIPLLAVNIDHSERQHARIAGCILDGDPAGARSAMAEHLDGTAALLRGFLS
jgi:DNA-binding FadR family transcriptional regulator